METLQVLDATTRILQESLQDGFSLEKEEGERGDELSRDDRQLKIEGLTEPLTDAPP